MNVESKKNNHPEMNINLCAIFKNKTILSIYYYF